MIYVSRLNINFNAESANYIELFPYFCNYLSLLDDGDLYDFHDWIEQFEGPQLRTTNSTEILTKPLI